CGGGGHGTRYSARRLAAYLGTLLSGAFVHKEHHGRQRSGSCVGQEGRRGALGADLGRKRPGQRDDGPLHPAPGPERRARMNPTTRVSGGLLLVLALTLHACISLRNGAYSSSPLFTPNYRQVAHYQALTREQDQSLGTCAETHTCDRAHYTRALLALYESQAIAAKHFQDVIDAAPKSHLAYSSQFWLRFLQNSPTIPPWVSSYADATERPVRGLLRLLTMRLSAMGFDVTTSMTGEEALAVAKREVFDLALTDLRLPDRDGLSVLEELRLIHPDLPVLLLTAHGSIPSAVEAMQKGAFGYLTKPFDDKELKATLEKALAQQRMGREIQRLKLLVKELYGLENVVARSPKMQALLEQVARVAESDATICISGETGTGKEVIARVIHCNSQRARGPF